MNTKYLSESRNARKLILPMSAHTFSIGTQVFPKISLASGIMIANILAWYSFASALLLNAIDATLVLSNEKLLAYGVGFGGAVGSLFLGALVASKFADRKRFLFFWTVLGVLSSLTTVFLQITSFEIIIVVALLTSVSFGLGLPVVMALFAEGTRPENRGRTSAVVLLSFSFATIALKLALTENIVINALVLASWRATGFIAFLLLRQHKKIDAEKSSSFVQILKTRQFFLYLVPWAIFSLVNYLAWSINMEFLGEDFIHFLTSIENIIAGIFALIAGFVSDIFGRKRLLMAGFVIFGLGYAVLGVFPLNIYSWYLYTVMDGVAWGIIYIIFLFTIWGDLAEGKPSEKHYALGLLPSSLSSFLHLTVGSFVATAVSPYAIFSFAAFFLFLAVLPLMYAPETLPEKTLKDRELRQYIDKAKKAKEKYA